MFGTRILLLTVLLIVVLLVKHIANNLSEKFLVDMKLFEMDLLDKCEDIAQLKHQYYSLINKRAKAKYFDRKFSQFQQATIEMNQLIATSTLEIHENYEHQNAKNRQENNFMKILRIFRVVNETVLGQGQGQEQHWRCQQFLEKKYYDFRTRGEIERILANRQQSPADLKSTLDNYNRNLLNEVAAVNCEPHDFLASTDNSNAKFEVDFLSFEHLNSTWNEIAFLYEDLLEFVKLRISQKYRLNFTSDDDQPIPSHLLGTILGDDWTNLFEFVLPYPEFVKRNLFDKIENNRTIDNLWKEIAFNSSLEIDIIDNYDSCPVDLLHYCRTATTKLTICNRLRVSDYFDLFEKYIENVLLKTDRNYGLAAAIAAATATIPNDRRKIPIFNELLSIMNCFNALDTIFVRNSTDSFELKMMRKLLLALRFLPKLAYYQFVEKWRMELFAKNDTLDSKTILALWSAMRLQEQNVEDSSSTFLFDPNIFLNKPYIGKFFATIMQFQLLDETIDNDDNENSDFRFPTNQFPTFLKKVLENYDNDDDDNGDDNHKNYLIRELLVSKIVRYFRPVFAYLRNTSSILPEFQEEKQPQPQQQPSITTTIDSSMETSRETAETVTNSVNATVSILASVIANNSNENPNRQQEQPHPIDALLEFKVAACAFTVTFVTCFILIFLLIFLKRRCCKKTKFPKNRRYS